MEIIRADKPHLIEKFKQLVAEDAQGKNIIKFQSSSRELWFISVPNHNNLIITSLKDNFIEKSTQWPTNLLFMSHMVTFNLAGAL